MEKMSPSGKGVLYADYGAPREPFEHIWNATGMTPGSLLLAPEMHQYLDLLSGVPGSGIRWHRIHYLFELVTAERTSLGIKYGWDLLDRALDALAERGIHLFFEIMGIPSDIIDDFEDPNQLAEWRNFISTFADRYRSRFGAETLRQWYFESWNEPDVGWWKFGEQGFLNYYDVTVAALEDVDRELRIGGPGTAMTLSPMFKAFLAHCDSGRNYVTGASGARLDFISVHEKGVWNSLDDLTPRTLGIIEKEMRAVEYIRSAHPHFANIPFINGECDPQVGWLDHHTYHALPYYAAYVPRLVEQHRRIMGHGQGVNYRLLCNDNGYLGGWGNRTLLTYYGARKLTKAQQAHKTDLDEARREVAAAPQGHELIKKPVLAAMEMLGVLGAELAPCVWNEGNEDLAEKVKVFATMREEGPALLVFSGVDSPWESDRFDIKLRFAGLDAGLYAQAVFTVDRDHGNPFAIWDLAGGPAQPTAGDFDRIRAAEGPVLIEQPRSVEPVGGEVALDLKLLMPSVSLVLLSRVDSHERPRIIAQRTAIYPGLHGRETASIGWTVESPGNRIVLFDIYLLGSGQPELLRGDQLSTTFLHSRPAGRKSSYGIVARTLAGIRSEMFSVDL